MNDYLTESFHGKKFNASLPHRKLIYNYIHVAIFEEDRNFFSKGMESMESLESDIFPEKDFVLNDILQCCSAALAHEATEADKHDLFFIFLVEYCYLMLVQQLRTTLLVLLSNRKNSLGLIRGGYQKHMKVLQRSKKRNQNPEIRWSRVINRNSDAYDLDDQQASNTFVDRVKVPVDPLATPTVCRSDAGLDSVQSTPVSVAQSQRKTGYSLAYNWLNSIMSLSPSVVNNRLEGETFSEENDSEKEDLPTFDTADEGESMLSFETAGQLYNSSPNAFSRDNTETSRLLLFDDDTVDTTLSTANTVVLHDDRGTYEQQNAQPSSAINPNTINSKQSAKSIGSQIPASNSKLDDLLLEERKKSQSNVTGKYPVRSNPISAIEADRRVNQRRDLNIGSEPAPNSGVQNRSDAFPRQDWRQITASKFTASRINSSSMSLRGYARTVEVKQDNLLLRYILSYQN